MDDATRIAESLHTAGVEVRLAIWPKHFRFMTIADIEPKAAESISMANGKAEMKT